ncbi:MAG: carbon-monoxide dehydrogenase catalytic subunit [Nitrospirae bacterium GWC2_57_13]|jgi:anaerobic carbon-monoxide dehydrogenase catalytic subunit|nr:MAG: carbon-monoxide dehydrogenase catalytic subunit [Nitrospirae bacterium GWC2_57_13]
MREDLKSVDPAAQVLLKVAEKKKILTSFERAEKLKPCPIGHEGACCKVCHMGPCRLVGKEDEAAGVCGATLPVVTARNFARMVAAGTAAHSDHARDLANTLLAVARGEAKDFQIKDVRKLNRVAGYLGINVEGKSVNKVAEDVALKFLEQFGQQRGELAYLSRAPKKRQEIWKKLGIAPRAIDRECVEMLHRTAMGVDQEPNNIMLGALRTSLADGWGGSMMGTDISDILFGTPKPLKTKASLDVFKEDHVNLVVHGHEPSFAEMLVQAQEDPEMVAYAKSKGAKGVNLVGMCCTANEILMRHGIPTAGGFLQQELGILTGMVEAMVVDVQCIMPAISQLSKQYHTKIVTTTAKGKMIDAEHVEYDDHHAMDIAKKVVRLAIDNFQNRKKESVSPAGIKAADVIAGFSDEYIEYMQGGRYRGSYRPLNDAIISGRIRGIVGLAGCNNPRISQDSIHNFLTREFIKNDVLVVQTGCSAMASAKAGYMTPENALENAGQGLREVCEAIGIPPVLHLGSCVDNSRILTIASNIANEGGLGDDIGGLPAVGIAPEWMSEKAIAIGTYFAASGVPVIFGAGSPVKASKTLRDIMENKWWEMMNAAFYFEEDPGKMLELALKMIDAAREKLKIRKYEPGRFGTERVLMDMAARRGGTFATPHGVDV